MVRSSIQRLSVAWARYWDVGGGEATVDFSSSCQSSSTIVVPFCSLDTLTVHPLLTLPSCHGLHVCVYQCGMSGDGDDPSSY